MLSASCYSQNCLYSCMTNSHVDTNAYRSGQVGYFQFNYNPDGWLDSDIIRLQFCERSGAYVITQIIVRTYGSLTPKEKTSNLIKIAFTTPQSVNTDSCMFIWGYINGNYGVRFLATLNKDNTPVPVVVPPVVATSIFTESLLEIEGEITYYNYSGNIVAKQKTTDKTELINGLYIFSIAYTNGSYVTGKRVFLLQ